MRVHKRGKEHCWEKRGGTVPGTIAPQTVAACADATYLVYLLLTQ
ncbi:MAG: hypothetical protein JWP88_610 [Flaviaesturariibacter sp.]|nr:hypothetical protein [Flaviaesturariibacter sp.]